MSGFVAAAGDALASGAGSRPLGRVSSDKGTPPRTRCRDCATRELCLIGGLPAAVVDLGPVRRERSFSRRETLSREGELGSHFKIVKVGMVFICRASSEGVARPVAIAGPGAVFDFSSYLSQPNQVSAVAGSSGRCCEIPTDRIESLARSDKTFRERIGEVYGENFGMLAKWAEALGRRNVVAQVAASLQLLAANQHGSSVTIPSHTDLAELLGTTRESVARALATLEAAQCLRRTSLRRCEVFPGPLRQWLSAKSQSIVS